MNEKTDSTRHVSPTSHLFHSSDLTTMKSAALLLALLLGDSASHVPLWRALGGCGVGCTLGCTLGCAVGCTGSGCSVARVSGEVLHLKDGGADDPAGGATRAKHRRDV